MSSRWAEQAKYWQTIPRKSTAKLLTGVFLLFTDLLAIVTDGLTKAANKRDEDLGFEPLKAVLLERASAPLQIIARDLRAAALRQGTQVDDQEEACWISLWK